MNTLVNWLIGNRECITTHLAVLTKLLTQVKTETARHSAQ